MYSPFFDNKGHPLPIEKIKYCHLSQLADCDEGHHVEYKLLLEDGGKAQLAKEITSFANCEGGWLIVGIDDKTKKAIPITKQDYSQRVGKIASRISPMPEFDTRFLTTPDDKKTGVLLIYVYEGKKAPYICNGNIYVRSGSSKEPIKPADRGNVEYLFERSKKHEEEIDNFCKRDYFYPFNNAFFRKVTYPIANVYLKNISSKRDNSLDIYANRDKLIDFVKSQNSIFTIVSYSMESIIFMHKQTLPGTNSSTLVFELFYDWSLKITVPLGLPDESQKKKYERIFTDIDINIDDVNNFNLIDGSALFNSLAGCLFLFADIAKHYKLKESNYAYCFEIENAEEDVAVFYGDQYFDYIKKYGIPYIHKAINRSQISYLRDRQKLQFIDLPFSLIADDLGGAFGFRSDCILDILRESNKQYREQIKG